MTAMREAFEKWWRYASDKNFNSQADFDAGWQAAIEHIKAQGVVAYAHNISDNDDIERFIVDFEPIHCMSVHNGDTPLYRIPEDV